MSPKQPDLPGMENRKIADLQEAAEKLLHISDQKKQLAAKEKEAGLELIKIMRRHKREHYRYKGIVVTIIEGNDKVQVRETAEETDEQKEAREAQKAADDSGSKPN